MILHTMKSKSLQLMQNSYYGAFDNRNYQIALKISNKFNGACVTDVIIDEEFGNVTATLNGVANVDCGFLEEYEF